MTLSVTLKLLCKNYLPLPVLCELLCDVFIVSHSVISLVLHVVDLHESE